jgi:DNA polymerase-3 subunit epsilon
MLLFYDFETTGFPLWKEPSDHKGQPHIVQIGALLVDERTREVVSSLDVIIHPTDWTISPEAAAIHGITQEMAFTLGVDEGTAVKLLHQMSLAAGSRGSFVQTFDARIMRIAMKRYIFPDAEIEAFAAAPAFCLAQMSKPYCAVPPSEKMLAAGQTHKKAPNLSEAYEILIGKKMVNAHKAMADATACMEVYFAVCDRVAA